MNPVLRFFLCLLLLVVGATRANAVVDPGWLAPGDNENFGTAPFRTPDYGKEIAYGAAGVLVRVEFGNSVQTVNFYTGNLLLGQTRKYDFSSTPGKKVFYHRLFFPTAGPRTLIAQGDDGFQTITLNGPTINILPTAPPPTIAHPTPTQISSAFATLHGTVHTHGVDFFRIYFEYGKTIAYGQQAQIPETSEIYTENVVPREKRITGLQPGTGYHYRMVVQTNAGTFPGPDSTFATTANESPVTRPDIGVLKTDGTCIVYCTSNDSDDSLLTPDALTIVAVTNGAHGTVEISQTDIPRLRYTADNTFTDIDTFTYTVADQFGAESTGSVEIRSVSKHHQGMAGSYFAFVGSSPQFPIGSVSIQVLPTGAYTGSLTIHGIAQGFSGRFPNEEDDDTSSSYGMEIFTAPGLKATRWGFYLNYGPDGIPVIAGGSGTGIYFDIDRSQQLVPPTEEVVEEGQYVMALPTPNMEGRNVETLPQGNGFAALRVAKKGGRLSGAGRTGDNQPFSVGGRMKRDRRVDIAAASGVARRARLTGSLGFNEDTGAGGDLLWYSPERSKGAYRNAFFLAITAQTEKFVPPTGKNPIFTFRPGWFPVIEVVVQDREGEVVSTDKILVTHHKLDSGAGDPTRVRMSINPRTGVFSGTFKQTGQPAKKLTGIVQPKAGRGLGVAGAAGTDAPVEIIVP